MNDLSGLPAPFESRDAAQEPAQDETEPDMSRRRTEQGRLDSDSDWVRRLKDVTGAGDAAPKASVFSPSDPPARGTSALFAPPDGPPRAARSVGWADLPRARADRADGQNRPVLAAQDRDSDVSRAFDQLRTRLVHTLRQNGWSRIAVSAPTSGAGTTFTSVNLAVSLSRVPDSRTILVDLNQRQPGIADALGVCGVGEIRHFLSGRVPMAQHMTRHSDTLALALSTDSFADSAELLHDRRSVDTLERMQAALAPDTVLYDMPAILEHDDLGAFLPQVDGVLLVSDGTRTTARQIAECERVLEGQCPLLGVILNRARPSTLRRVLR